MISPFKAALGYDYKAFEARLEGAIHMRYGLPAELPAEVHRVIKRADRVCAFFEATQIAGFSVEEARKFFGRPPKGLIVTIEPKPAAKAQIQFLERFETLLRRAEREARA
jgi:5'-deoxynucleotidase YfbR-like HD superfamily hydrolase